MTKALRSRQVLPPDVSVTAVDARVIGEGGGEMGDIALVSITLSDGAAEALPRKLVAKFSPQACALSHASMSTFPLFHEHFSHGRCLASSSPSSRRRHGHFPTFSMSTFP